MVFASGTRPGPCFCSFAESNDARAGKRFDPAAVKSLQVSRGCGGLRNRRARMPDTKEEYSTPLPWYRAVQEGVSGRERAFVDQNLSGLARNIQHLHGRPRSQDTLRNLPASGIQEKMISDEQVYDAVMGVPNIESQFDRGCLQKAVALSFQDARQEVQNQRFIIYHQNCFLEIHLVRRSRAGDVRRICQSLPLSAKYGCRSVSV
jgi:hypothetical protein